MVRPPLSQVEHARGAQLGTMLREARGTRSMAEIAAASGIPAETLRKIETGRIATPAFFTVAALAGALGLSLEEIAQRCAQPKAVEPKAVEPKAVEPGGAGPGGAAPDVIRA
jgi:transcriptional regulator with XRE-family HTH domain